MFMEGDAVRRCVRLIEMQRLLKDRPRSIGELAERCECSTRTVARDLAELQELPGLVIEQDGAGRWRLEGRLDTTTLRDGRQWQGLTG